MLTKPFPWHISVVFPGLSPFQSPARSVRGGGGGGGTGMGVFLVCPCGCLPPGPAPWPPCPFPAALQGPGVSVGQSREERHVCVEPWLSLEAARAAGTQGCPFFLPSHSPAAPHSPGHVFPLFVIWVCVLGAFFLLFWILVLPKPLIMFLISSSLRKS